MHIELSGCVDVAVPPSEAFRYFTPEGERLWVPEWQPDYLHPLDGALAPGLVFRTNHGGETTVWLVTRCDEGTAVEYVRVTPETRIGSVSVELSPAGPNGSQALVSYRMTSLSARGDQLLQAFADGFPEMLADWQRRIGYALALDPPKR